MYATRYRYLYRFLSSCRKNYNCGNFEFIDALNLSEEDQSRFLLMMEGIDHQGVIDSQLFSKLRSEFYSVVICHSREDWMVLKRYLLSEKKISLKDITLAGTYALFRERLESYVSEDEIPDDVHTELTYRAYVLGGFLPEDYPKFMWIYAKLLFDCEDNRLEGGTDISNRVVEIFYDDSTQFYIKFKDESWYGKEYSVDSDSDVGQVDLPVTDSLLMSLGYMSQDRFKEFKRLDVDLEKAKSLRVRRQEFLKMKKEFEDLAE